METFNIKNSKPIIKLVSMIMGFTFLAILLNSCKASNSQAIGEREITVKPEQMPAKALERIRNLPNNISHLRYYKEIQSDKEESFETKFKLNNRWYCIEFDIAGNVEDIEIIVRMDDINAEQRMAIESYFKETFSKVNIEEVELQYSNDDGLEDSNFIAQVLKKEVQLLPYFDIEADVRENGKRFFAEFYFDNSGQFLSYELIHPKSYGYIKY